MGVCFPKFTATILALTMFCKSSCDTTQHLKSTRNIENACIFAFQVDEAQGKATSIILRGEKRD